MAKDKAPPHQPSKSIIMASIQACISNGERILDDAMQVEFQEPPCTKLMLSMISQEEFAKAFLLFLVREDVVPWSPQLLRAMNNHACKQLVGVIIEYVDPEWETIEQLQDIIAADFDLGDRMPPKVATAINILRHEKMGRWESNNWDWAEEPEYERSILRIAEGGRDKIKQDALYVRLGGDGSVVSVPAEVTQVSADEEYARADRHKWFVSSIVRDGEHGSIAYEKVRKAITLLFDEKN